MSLCCSVITAVDVSQHRTILKMPMVKRAIEPSDISRSQLDSEIKNELECVANNTLACIIQQLSSLSKHSEDLFGELYAETSILAARTGKLITRIENLKHKIVQLNPTVEEVLLQEINLRKPFKSSPGRDQQIMLCSTRPLCINEAYMNCEAPPALNELDIFREDGKSSLKFYTDPNYFVELWYSEMKAAQHHQRKPKHKHGQIHKTSTKPKALRTPKNKIEEFKDFRHGPEFVENFRKEHSFTDGSNSNRSGFNAIQCQNNKPATDNVQHVHAGDDFMDSSGPSRALKHANYEERDCFVNTRMSSISHICSPRPIGPPPEPPKKQPKNLSEATQHSGSLMHLPKASMIHLQTNESNFPAQAHFSPASNFHHEESFSSENSLPPPPPSPRIIEINPLAEHQLPSPPKMTMKHGSADDFELSHLPPPPPLSNSPNGEIFPPQVVGESKDHSPFETEEPSFSTSKSVQPQPDEESLASDSSSATCSADALKSNHSNDKGPLVRDTRSDLLSAIREGIQLRKVEEHRLKSEQNKKVGTLDVQSIMEAAFEMRRKALEENESEEDEENEANWSD